MTTDANKSIDNAAHDTTDEKHQLDTLRQLRDEIRLKIHLAQLDAKTAWDQLETKYNSLEQRASSEGGTLMGATAQLARELQQSFVHFRERLHGS